jgi:hypothetical protein
VMASTPKKENSDCFAVVWSWAQPHSLVA